VLVVLGGDEFGMAVFGMAVFGMAVFGMAVFGMRHGGMAAWRHGGMAAFGMAAFGMAQGAGEPAYRTLCIVNVRYPPRFSTLSSASEARVTCISI